MVQDIDRDSNDSTPTRNNGNGHSPTPAGQKARSGSSPAELLGAWVAGLSEKLGVSAASPTGQGSVGRRRAGVVVAALLVIVAASGVLVWAALHRYPAAAGELVVGYQEPIASVDPVRLEGAPPGANVAVSSLVFETLVVKGVDGEILPGLAETWRISPDGREIRFRLVGGKRFSDGSPVDAAAVKASLQRLPAGPTPVPGQGQTSGSVPPGQPGMTGTTSAAPVTVGLGPLTDIVIEKPRQLVLKFSDPYPALWSILAGPEAAIVRQSPGEVAGLAGSGPYRLEKWESDGTITLAARPATPRGFVSSFIGQGPAVSASTQSTRTVATRSASGPARYWQALTGQGSGRPARVVFKRFADAQALGAAFQSAAAGLVYPAAGDEAAFVGGPAGAGTGAGVGVGAGTAASATAFFRPTGELFYMGFKVGTGLFGDAAVRQAAASAVNRAALVKSAFPGRAVPSDHLWPDLSQSPSQAIEAQGQTRFYKEDPATAKQMLNGKAPLDVELLTVRSRDALTLAKAVATQLDAAGFRAKVTALDGATLFRRLDAGEFQAYVLSFRWPDPGILYDFLHSSRKGATNRTGYSNPQADAQLDALVTKVDPAARRQALLGTESVVLKDAPWVPLAALERPIVTRSAPASAWADMAFGAHGELWLDLARPAAAR